MEIIYPDLIAKALQLPLPQVRNTIGLLESGATIPFISRYRKEMTGGLNEVQITDVKNWLDKLTELKARKDTILKALEKQEKLTPELKARIESSWDSNEIEDIYLPYKPKRVTRAEMARKKGLEPLAKLIAAQKEPFLSGRVPAFVQGEVKDEEEALSGARDIIAEWVNENERTRNQVRSARRSFQRKSSKEKKRKVRNTETTSSSKRNFRGVSRIGFWQYEEARRKVSYGFRLRRQMTMPVLNPYTGSINGIMAPVGNNSNWRLMMPISVCSNLPSNRSLPEAANRKLMKKQSESLPIISVSYCWLRL